MPTANPPPQRRNFAPGRRDRRSFLKTVGRAGLAAASVQASEALVFGPGATRESGRAYAKGREPLIQPAEIRSDNGVLNATITAAPGRVQLGEYAFSGFLYNGVYLPPLLRSRLGDTMRITFRNNLVDDPS